MTDPQLTRCPACRTLFRVTGAQLALREGRVRCGRCQHVFDALAHVESGDAGRTQTPALSSGVAATGDVASGTEGAAPARAVSAVEAPSPGETASEGEGTRGREVASALESASAGESAFAGESAMAGESAPAGEVPASALQASDAEFASSADVAVDAGAEAREGESSAATDAAERAGADGEPDRGRVDGDTGMVADRFSWEQGPGPAPARSRVWAVLVPLLALLLAAQAVYPLRHTLAARVPALKPTLLAACARLGCTIEPPRGRAQLSIEASELQVDAAHKGLLILTATIRNRAEYAVAYPHLELTLTDLQDQPVVRRVLSPAEYAGGTARLDTGVAANGEVAVKLFIDASATQQQGYRLSLFYP